jgi:hypothetical protein
MAQTLLTSSVITKEFLAVLHSSLHVTRNVDHSWNSLFGKSFGPVSRAGATVSIRKPALGDVRTSWAMNQSDLTEKSVSLTIDQVRGVDLNFSDAELALSVDDFSSRYIVPNAQKLAAVVDNYVATYMVQHTHNAVGTPGTSPNDSVMFLNAKWKLNDALAPLGGRKVAVIEPQTESTIVKALSGQYNPQPFISTMFEKGAMPSSNALGLEWYMSQVIPGHTCGSRDDTTPIAAGYTAATGAIPYTGADTSATWKVGDVITVAGVYAVNYETKVTTGQLQQFVVTTDETASGGNGTLYTTPIAIATGADKNVTAVPTTGAIVNFGTASTAYKQNLVFAPESYGVAFADLEIPNNMDMAQTVSSDGISVRFLRGYDIVNGRFLSRMDVFFGVAALRPEWACRVYGA